MFKDDSAFFSGVRTIVQKMHSVSSKKLAPYGLNRFEMLVLLKVYEEDGIRQRDIVSEIKRERSGIGIAVRELSKKGYIFRQPDMHDRRIRKLFAANKGFEIKKEIIGLKRSVEKYVIDGIDPEELILLEHIVSKMERWIALNDFEHFIEKQQIRGY